MYTYNLNPRDVIDAISNQNKEISSGQIASPPVYSNEPFQLTVNVPGQLSTPEEFANIIIKSSGTKADEKANSSSSAKIIGLKILVM